MRHVTLTLDELRLILSSLSAHTDWSKTGSQHAQYMRNLFKSHVAVAREGRWNDTYTFAEDELRAVIAAQEVSSGRFPIGQRNPYRELLDRLESE